MSILIRVAGCVRLSAVNPIAWAAALINPTLHRLKVSGEVSQFLTAVLANAFLKFLDGLPPHDIVDLRRVPADNLHFNKPRRVGGVELPYLSFDLEGIEGASRCGDAFLCHDLGRARPLEVRAGRDVFRLKFGAPRLAHSKR